jgi:hypothetical protein
MKIAPITGPAAPAERLKVAPEPALPEGDADGVLDEADAEAEEAPADFDPAAAADEDAVAEDAPCATPGCFVKVAEGAVRISAGMVAVGSALSLVMVATRVGLTVSEVELESSLSSWRSCVSYMTVQVLDPPPVFGQVSCLLGCLYATQQY